MVSNFWQPDHCLCPDNQAFMKQTPYSLGLRIHWTTFLCWIMSPNSSARIPGWQVARAATFPQIPLSPLLISLSDKNKFSLKNNLKPPLYSERHLADLGVTQCTFQALISVTLLPGYLISFQFWLWSMTASKQLTLRGHCLTLLSAERFVNGVWGRLRDSLKSQSGPQGLDSKWGLTVPQWLEQARRKLQDWTSRVHSSPPSHSPQSIQITLDSQFRVRNSGNKVQLWARVERSQSKI